MVTQHLLEDSVTYLRPAVLLTGRLQSSDQTFSVKGWTVDTFRRGGQGDPALPVEWASGPRAGVSVSWENVTRGP